MLYSYEIITLGSNKHNGDDAPRIVVPKRHKETTRKIHNEQNKITFTKQMIGNFIREIASITHFRIIYLFT